MNITTERLTLRPFEDRDLDALSDLLRDGEVKKTYMLPDFANAEASLALARRLQSLSRDPNRFVTGIFLGDALAGFLNDVEITEEFVEMGYVVAPAYWGRGYATEALRAVICHLHSKGVPTVLTGAFSENLASIRVMEKAGMTRIDRTDDLEYRGKVHKCVYFVAKSPAKPC